MRTRLMRRAALGTAATALALGVVGAGAGTAAATQHDAQHHGKGWHPSVVKYYLKYEKKKQNFTYNSYDFRQNQIGGGNVVGHFYHGGNYAVLF